MSWGEEFSEADYQRYRHLTAEERQRMLQDEATPEAVTALLLYQQGQKLLQDKEFGPAIEQFDLVLNLRPHWPEVWTDRGLALLKQGNYSATVESCDRAIELQSDNQPAWRYRGLALFGLRQFESAVTSCQQAIDLNSQDQEAYRTLSDALHCLGRYDEAIPNYDRVLELKPEDGVAWGQRGRALQKLGRYDEAITSFDKRLELEPKDHKLWYQRGLALRRLGQPESAIASFDQALTLQPEFYAATRSKLFLLLISGQLGSYLKGQRSPAELALFRNDLRNLLDSFTKTKLPALVVIALVTLSSTHHRGIALAVAGVFLLIAAIGDLIAESRR